MLTRLWFSSKYSMSKKFDLFLLNKLLYNGLFGHSVIRKTFGIKDNIEYESKETFILTLSQFLSLPFSLDLVM